MECGLIVLTDVALGQAREREANSLLMKDVLGTTGISLIQLAS